MTRSDRLNEDAQGIVAEQITKLLSQSDRDPAFSRIALNLQGKLERHINVSGMTDAQKAYMTAALAQKTGKPPIIIVADELRARIFQTDLEAFLGKEVYVLRAREQTLADVDASSRNTELSRIKVLSALVGNDFAAVIITAGALLSRHMPVREFMNASLNIRVGQRVRPEDLAMRLTENGYEHVRKVEGEAEYSRRGDVFDVYPVGSHLPVRLSFFDDEIEQMKYFDMQTQRSSETLSSLKLNVAREVVIASKHRETIAQHIIRHAEEARAQAIKSSLSKEVYEGIMRVCAHDADRVRDGVFFPGLEKWINIIYPKTYSVLSYFRSSDCFVVVDEIAQVRKRMDAAQAEFMQRYTSHLARGQVTYLSEKMLFESTALMIEMDRGMPVITLCQLASSGNGLPQADNVVISGRECTRYRGHEENLAQTIIQRNTENKQTFILAGEGSRRDKLVCFLRERGAMAPVLDRALPTGFEYPKADILVVGAHDIFGVDRPMRKKRATGVRIDLFSDLVPGELVVHDQHGIGRYDGIVNIESGGTRRDYLKITYASEDSLYIPIENLDAIQKYVGSESKRPKLTRLGGQEWNRMKARARGTISQLAFSLVALYAKRHRLQGHAFSEDTVWQKQFEEDFPFTETPDQIEAIRQIKADMESTKIMDRLLCGDVGFGKTEVAFRAIFKCVMDGFQAVMLAPTTVLVQQHYDNLCDRLNGYPVRVGMLSRFVSPSEMKKTIQGMNNGAIDIVVGTHRLLSKDVNPKKLGLLVVDEEQRFGVAHKEKIKNLRSEVDVLTLTATPIPRTLHMSMAGIRDISVLEDPPLDRRSVQTYVMEYDPDIIVEACLREISRQGQIFYLFNDTRKIEEKANELEAALPGARIAVAHGKMSERRLEPIIEDFVEQKTDILVCTTIIESGIDMPNVNTIIVENAERFGLSQLYQLRGRVGRSDRQAYAYITYRKDKILTEEAEKRLAAIRDFTELGSGFKIALKDLEVRGAGNLLGAEQHGQMDVIGYELYSRMLDEEIKKIQGIEVQKLPEAVVEIDIDAYLSQEYIPDEGQRMDAYRRIAAISEYKDYVDVREELTDCYGVLNKEADILTDVSYIRNLASQQGFERVSLKADGVYFYYAVGAKPDMEAFSRVLAHPEFKDHIMLSAMAKPFVKYRAQTQDSYEVVQRVRDFFSILEGVSDEEANH